MMILLHSSDQDTSAGWYLELTKWESTSQLASPWSTASIRMKAQKGIKAEVLLKTTKSMSDFKRNTKEEHSVRSRSSP